MLSTALIYTGHETLAEGRMFGRKFSGPRSNHPHPPVVPFEMNEDSAFEPEVVLAQYARTRNLKDQPSFKKKWLESVSIPLAIILIPPSVLKPCPILHDQYLHLIDYFRRSRLMLRHGSPRFSLRHRRSLVPRTAIPKPTQRTVCSTSNWSLWRTSSFMSLTSIMTCDSTGIARQQRHRHSRRTFRSMGLGSSPQPTYRPCGAKGPRLPSFQIPPTFLPSILFTRSTTLNCLSVPIAKPTIRRYSR